VYEIWRQRNPECRTYLVAKKLMKLKNYIMKNKTITQLEIEEIKKELQGAQMKEKKNNRSNCIP
jgi:hypothetical protein